MDVKERHVLSLLVWVVLEEQELVNKGITTERRERLVGIRAAGECVAEGWCLLWLRKSRWSIANKQLWPHAKLWGNSIGTRSMGELKLLCGPPPRQQMFPKVREIALSRVMEVIRGESKRRK